MEWNARNEEDKHFGIYKNSCQHIFGFCECIGLYFFFRLYFELCLDDCRTYIYVTRAWNGFQFRSTLKSAKNHTHSLLHTYLHTNVYSITHNCMTQAHADLSEQGHNERKKKFRKKISNSLTVLFEPKKGK